MTRSSVSPTRPLLALCVALAAAVPLLPGPASASERVVIRGGGWGHGIGMSQYGAYGLAKQGKSSTGILKHYYRGVDVVGRTMPDIRVGLLQYDSSISMSSNEGPMKVKVAGADDAIVSGGRSDTFRFEPSTTGRVRVYKNNNLVVRDGRRAFGGPSKPLRAVYEELGSSVSVFDKSLAYRYGFLEIGSYSSSTCSPGYCLRLVMESSMQKYLYGLGEVPASWPQAVLQAQAIAGRTYAFRKIKAYGQHRSPCDCAVVDSVLDQAYVGDAKRTGSGEYWDDWKSAVDRTDKKVILYKGSPIEALYSSSSGGHTENNENVWGGTPAPYLRGVKDPADDVSVNPNHEWSVEMSRADLSSRLNAAYGTGTLKRVELVRPFGVSGRVTVVKPSGGGVRIVGTARTVRVSGWSLRSALGLKDTLFRIEFYFEVWKEMQRKYRRLGGAPGVARSNAYFVPKNRKGGLGRTQDFDRGRLTWRRKTDKTVWQWGRVLRRYDRMGRERSRLGMPTSDIWGPGWYLGANYVGGVIVWSTDHGAFPVVGKWGRVYRSRGGAAGALGVPLSRRHKADSLPEGGRRQNFSKGRLYDPPSDSKIYALWGRIANRYQKIGEATSPCGYPTSHVKKVNGGQRANFRNGTISHSKSEGVTVTCPGSAS